MPFDTEVRRQKHGVAAPAARRHLKRDDARLSATFGHGVPRPLARPDTPGQSDFELVLDRLVRFLGILWRLAGYLHVQRLILLLLFLALRRDGRFLIALPLRRLLFPLGLENGSAALDERRDHVIDQMVRGVSTHDRRFARLPGRWASPMALNVHVFLDELPLGAELLLQGEAQRQLVPRAVDQWHEDGGRRLRRAHGHQRHEMRVLETQNQWLSAAMGRRTFQRKVDAPKEHRRERVPERIHLHSVGHDHDGAAHGVRHSQDVYGIEESVLPSRDIHHLGPFACQLLVRDLYTSRPLNVGTVRFRRWHVNYVVPGHLLDPAASDQRLGYGVLEDPFHGRADTGTSGRSDGGRVVQAPNG
mmetsp:Transcript_113654/g.321359  ORF Transcript_113654/g.321359 Transcript_113654/m.321359 type:complete len:360 (+) Transcript_113654:224-1303(+)